MLAAISAKQFAEWQAFYNLEPWGTWRDEMRFARLCAVISEPNRDRKARPRPFTVREFLPSFITDELDPDETASSETPDALKQKMLGFAALLNSGAKRKPRDPKSGKSDAPVTERTGAPPSRPRPRGKT